MPCSWRSWRRCWRCVSRCVDRHDLLSCSRRTAVAAPRLCTSQRERRLLCAFLVQQSFLPEEPSFLKVFLPRDMGDRLGNIKHQEALFGSLRTSWHRRQPRRLCRVIPHCHCPVVVVSHCVARTLRLYFPPDVACQLCSVSCVACRTCPPCTACASPCRVSVCSPWCRSVRKLRHRDGVPGAGKQVLLHLCCGSRVGKGRLLHSHGGARLLPLCAGEACVQWSRGLGLSTAVRTCSPSLHTRVHGTLVLVLVLRPGSARGGSARVAVTLQLRAQRCCVNSRRSSVHLAAATSTVAPASFESCLCRCALPPPCCLHHCCCGFTAAAVRCAGCALRRGCGGTRSADR